MEYTEHYIKNFWVIKSKKKKVTGALLSLTLKKGGEKKTY